MHSISTSGPHATFSKHLTDLHLTLPELLVRLRFTSPSRPSTIFSRRSPPVPWTVLCNRPTGFPRRALGMQLQPRVSLTRVHSTLTPTGSGTFPTSPTHLAMFLLPQTPARARRSTNRFGMGRTTAQEAQDSTRCRRRSKGEWEIEWEE
jgi:hypothetical protein